MRRYVPDKEWALDQVKKRRYLDDYIVETEKRNPRVSVPYKSNRSVLEFYLQKAPTISQAQRTSLID